MSNAVSSCLSSPDSATPTLLLASDICERMGGREDRVRRGTFKAQHSSSSRIPPAPLPPHLYFTENGRERGREETKERKSLPDRRRRRWRGRGDLRSHLHPRPRRPTARGGEGSSEPHFSFCALKMERERQA